MEQPWIQRNQNSLADTLANEDVAATARSTNALREAQAAELPYERERLNTLNAANVAKAEAQTGKANAETGKAQQDAARQDLEFIARFPGDRSAVLGAFAKWETTMPNLTPIRERLEGIQDPNEFKSEVAGFAMSTLDQMQQAREDQKFTETQKQSGIDNAFQQGNLNVAQGNLGVAQAGLGERQRHNTAMENKPASGFSMSYDAEGRPVISTGGMMPKLTESQGKATALGMRGGEAVSQLNAIEDSGYVPDTATQAKQFAGNMLGSKNRFLDANAQKYEQAMLNFGTAIGRFESGAAIPEQEWQRFIDQYSARPGSTPEEIAQKRQNRETAIRGMGVSAGPGRAVLPPNTPRTAVTAVAQPPVEMKDLEYTAAKHGISIEEVKRRMGAAR